MTLLPARSEAIHCTSEARGEKRLRDEAEQHPPIQLARRTRRADSRQPRSTDRRAFYTSEISGTRFLRRISHHTPHEIENSDPQPVPKSIVRHAVPARPVDHIDIADVAALAANQRRQEAMQPVEIRQRQANIARKRLEPAAGVARAVAQDRAAHRVGEARLESLEGRWPCGRRAVRRPGRRAARPAPAPRSASAETPDRSGRRRRA